LFHTTKIRGEKSLLTLGKRNKRLNTDRNCD